MSEQPTIQLTDTEQAEKDEAERKRTLAETLDAVNAVLKNEDGFQRIEAITDDEWDRAQQLDDEEAANGNT